MSKKLAYRLRLTPEARDYLTGDGESQRGRELLHRMGAVDADGRLTPFGVLLARRALADLQVVPWTREESVALTARMVASGVRLNLPSGAERRAAVVALAKRGMSSVQIAEQIGGTPQGITKLARDAGVPIKRWPVPA
jgi:hypothetical protein